MSTAAPNNEKFIFENKPYLEDSSEEVISAIRNRVKILYDNVIILDDLPYNTPFSVTVLLEEVVSKKEKAGMDKFCLILDLRGSNRPSSESRRKINEMFSDLCEDIIHISYVTGRSTLLNTAIRFIMFQTQLNSFSFDTDLDQAFDSIKKTING